MKKTILEKVADNKFNAVKQLVRFIREGDKDPGRFEDLWENSFALEDELDEIILRIAHIIELEKALEEYDESCGWTIPILRTKALIYILSWIRIYEPLCGRNGWSSGSRWRTSCRTNDIGLYGGVL